MTILPKKKQSKDKNVDSDSAEHKTHNHHQNQVEARVAHNWNRNSPQWMPSTSRDGDVMPPHDPGGSGGHEKNPNHNKRRHRTSPHRTVRKHRTSIQSVVNGAAPLSPSDSVSGYNSGDEHEMPNFNCPTDIDELERWFERTLHEKKGLVIKKMGQDGACLFRAVADQIYGDQEMHAVIRKQCLDYMAKNSDHFKQYITEDFNTYLSRKRMDNCHGNNVEMQAIGEMYNRGVEVYQYSVEPINTFHSAYKTDNAPIRVSYHSGVHYNSIVDPWGATIGVGLGLPGLQPGMADKNLVKDAMRQSEDFHIEKTMMEDKVRETDWEVTQDTMQEQVARESYIQWLRDQEKQAKTRASTKSASATCSSSCYQDSAGSPQTRSPAPHPSSPHIDMVDASLATESLPVTGLVVNTRSPQGQCSPSGVSSAAAVGGAANFCETASIMNFNPALYGFGQWDEDDILARVMAESQREYLECLRKNGSSPSTSSNVPGDADPPVTRPQQQRVVFHSSGNVGGSVVFSCNNAEAPSPTGKNCARDPAGQAERNCGAACGSGSNSGLLLPKSGFVKSTGEGRDTDPGNDLGDSPQFCADRENIDLDDASVACCSSDS